MEPVFEKMKDMLNAYYPTFYLHSFEYSRTWAKITSIAKAIISEGCNVNLYQWNCVEGLKQVIPQERKVKVSEISEDESDEDILEPSMVLKYIYNH